MTNANIEFLVSRRTTKYHDPSVTLSDDQIRELVQIATTAPTSYWAAAAMTAPWHEPEDFGGAAIEFGIGKSTDAH